MSKYRQQQEDLHEALQKILVQEGEIISTWCVCYEGVAGDSTYFGYVHGPQGILPWRARGMYSQAIAFMDAEMMAAEMDGMNFEPPPPEDHDDS